MSSPMEPEFVERIFTRLLARYGAAWVRMWSGLDDADVKADWAAVLGGRTAREIRFALDNLPSDRPPNALQFRDLCRGVPALPLPRLPAPKPDPARVAQQRAIVDGMLERREGRARFAAGVQWAIELQERDQRGERLTFAQRVAYRQVLGGRR